MTKHNTNETIDLDAFLDELYGEGKHFKLYGKQWKLKSDLPAGIRLALREDKDLTVEQEVDLFKELLDPPSQYDELINLGLGATAWDAILRIALGTYGNLTPEQVLSQFRNEKLGKLLEPDNGGTPETTT